MDGRGWSLILSCTRRASDKEQGSFGPRCWAFHGGLSANLEQPEEKLVVRAKS